MHTRTHTHTHAPTRTQGDCEDGFDFEVSVDGELVFSGRDGKEGEVPSKDKIEAIARMIEEKLGLS